MINIVYCLVSPKLIEEVYTELDVNKGVIVRPSYLSICKADLRYYYGKRTPEVIEQKLPMALIHEGVAKVVKDNTGCFDVGDNVVMIPNIPLEDNKFVGENYLESSRFRSSGYDGFMEDYVSLPADRLIKLPDDLNLEVASFIELISVAAHAIKRFKSFSDEKRDSIGVWGDGSFGYITALMLKVTFPESRIIVFGAHREKLNMFTFADETYLFDDIPDDVYMDGGFECVGKVNAGVAINQMIDLVRPEATMALLGVSEYEVPINTRRILEKGLRIFGVNRSTKEDFQTVVDIFKMRPDIIPYLESLVTIVDVWDLDDIKKAFETDSDLRFGKTVMKWEI